ncbi:hypothetical protein BJX96DRAFT_143909 [Aspergillus floccosus]
MAYRFSGRKAWTSEARVMLITLQSGASACRRDILPNPSLAIFRSDETKSMFYLSIGFKRSSLHFVITFFLVCWEERVLSALS